ncbi:MAG TPA: hypothetical protein VN726_15355 [Hanamia sp.]|nr:hypothetical protein [Hanamia sp.]
MSYIKIDIGGKERGLKFNQGALVTFQGKIDPENIAATTGYALIWAGLKSNAYVKGEEFTETFETVCDWVDELKPEIVLEVIKVFQETQAFKNLLPKEDDKKKLVTKSTKRNALK